MLDSLILHVPLLPDYYTKENNLHNIKGDIADYQVKAVPSYFKRDPITKETTIGALFSPFESLPSSFGSSMAMKFYAVNVANTPPYVSLHASAKLLQGHNVYGGESVLNLSSEMLALLKENYPYFYNMLDIKDARISRIDSTYSLRLSSEMLVQPCLRFLKHADTGQRKSDNRRDFHNTVYFGLATSPYGGAKIYGKSYELKDAIKKYERSAGKGSLQSAKMLEIFNDDLVQYSDGLLRFECTTKARQLEKCNLPKNLWAFIDYQLNEDKNVLTKLWRMWFDPILSTLNGDIMPDIDDSDIYQKCRDKLWTQSKRPFKSLVKIDVLNRIFNIHMLPKPTNYGIFENPESLVVFGNISYTRANNAYNFYKLLKQDGYELVKSRYVRKTFNTNVKCLIDIGFKRAVLKNLSKDTLAAFPVSEILNFDFKVQAPVGYKPPVSEHIKDYTCYLNSATISVTKFKNLFALDGKLMPEPKTKKVTYE